MNQGFVENVTIKLDENDEYELRIYEDIYNDLFSDKEETAESIIERSYTITTIKNQVDMDRPMALISFPARYEGSIVEAHLAYMVFFKEKERPWVVVLPTPDQIFSAFGSSE